MPSVYGLQLEVVARGVAERFRADPGVAALTEPAVWVEASEGGIVATIIERSRAVEALSVLDAEHGPGVATSPPKDRPVLVVVVDRRFGGAQTFIVADPSEQPSSWPWAGSSIDE